MIANYHTHTWRCMHAEGAEEAYVRQAIRRGLHTLGFSDHTPYPFSNGYVSYFRMLPEQARDYFDTIERLQERYAGQLDIRIGVEAEYYPRYFAKLQKLLRQYPCQFLILGQHFIHNETDGVYSGAATEDPAVLRQYVTQTLEGLSTGAFLYLAHPDLLHWVGKEAPYRREMERLCLGAKELGYPLEINLLGLSDRRHYPNPIFWEIAGAVGNTVILGCDAHRPQDVAAPAPEQQGRELAAKYGLKLLEELKL